MFVRLYLKRARVPMIEFLQSEYDVDEKPRSKSRNILAQSNSK